MEAGKELFRATQRLHEKKNGTYKFKQLHKEAAELRPPHLDHAIHVGSVAIRGAGVRGRGLFTTKAVKAGDLLLCEKAFAHAHVDDDIDEALDRVHNSSVLISMETDALTMGAHADLIQMIYQKIYKSPSFAPAIIDLHHGSYDSIGFCTIDSAPVIDT